MVTRSRLNAAGAAATFERTTESFLYAVLNWVYVSATFACLWQTAGAILGLPWFQVLSFFWVNIAGKHELWLSFFFLFPLFW